MAYSTKNSVKRKTSLNIVVYERDENNTRMRISKMIGWNIWESKYKDKENSQLMEQQVQSSNKIVNQTMLVEGPSAHLPLTSAVQHGQTLTCPI